MAKRPAPVRGGRRSGEPTSGDPRRRAAVRDRRADSPTARSGADPATQRGLAGKRDAKRESKTDTRGKRGKRDVRPQQRSGPTGAGPQTSPFARPTAAPARPKTASQAKARAKARKAKAPKVVRLPLKERVLLRIAEIELNPRRLLARVPFVVLIIGALGMGLGVTLWLSTSAAERSYELGRIKETNQALQQQKEALERDVLEAQAAPALADSARNLGMIPSRDTAHLVQDPSGNWMVVGSPKPAQGVPPPPLNSPLPDAAPPAPPAAPAPRVVDPREQVVRTPEPADPAPAPAPVLAPAPDAPAQVMAAPAQPALPVPGLGTLPGPAQLPDPAAAAPLAAGPQVATLPAPQVAVPQAPLVVAPQAAPPAAPPVAVPQAAAPQVPVPALPAPGTPA